MTLDSLSLSLEIISRESSNFQLLIVENEKYLVRSKMIDFDRSTTKKKCIEPEYQERRKISTKRMKRDCKRRRAVSKGNLTANVYTPKILHDKSKDAEDFIVSLESSIESYPLQSRNEFVEELVYKGGERKKKNKGWREREEEKVRKKEKKTSTRCRLWYTYTICVRRPVRATRLRQ